MAELLRDRPFVSTNLRAEIELLAPIADELRAKLEEHQKRHHSRSRRRLTSERPSQHTTRLMASLCQISLQELTCSFNYHGFKDESVEQFHQLLQMSATVGDPKLRADVLIFTSGYQMWKGNPAEGLDQLDEAYNIGRTIQSSHIQLEVLISRCQVYMHQGDYDVGKELLSEIATFLQHNPATPKQVGMVKILQALQGKTGNAITLMLEALKMTRDYPLSKMTIFYSLAQQYYRLKKYAQSLQCIQRGIRIARQLHARNNLIFLYEYAAQIYGDIEQYDKGNRMLRKGMKLALAIGAPYPVQLITMQQGNYALKAGDYPTAIAHYNQLLENKAAKNNLRMSFFARRCIVEACVELGRYSEASEQIAEMENILNVIHSPIVLDHYFLQIGRLHHRQGNLELSIKELQQSVFFAEEAGNIAVAIKAHLELAEIHEKKGDLRQALHHMKEQSRLQREQSKQIATEQLHITQASIEVEQYRKEAHRARKQRQKAEAELEELTLSLLEKKELMQKVRSEARQLMADVEEQHLSAVSKTLRHLMNYVNEGALINKETLLHLRSADEEFYRRLRERFPDLTNGQTRLCGLIRAGLTNSDIASVLHIAPGSVKQQRYRLRKVLSLGIDTRLETFLAML